MPKWTGTWTGGRTYELDDRTVFVIEKMRHGRPYTIPLEVGTEKEALAELALFERDPPPLALYRSLAMDCPAPRPGQGPELGQVVEVAEAGGLYRHYERRAA